MDTLSPDERSERMSRIRAKDTYPEMFVRRLIHSMGYRYRLHQRDLPGVPDLVFASRRKVIFVHGCFWHRHSRCKLARLPKSRREFWVPKLEGNRKRDRKNQRRLQAMGWDVMVVWECRLSDRDSLRDAVDRFLSKHGPATVAA
jgi:DNA mismatch endonuclease (patch repair protein)